MLFASASQRSGGLQAFDFGNIAATTAGGMLEMVARTELGPARAAEPFAVVAPDVYDMADNWTEVGGGLIGLANCSRRSSPLRKS